MKNNRINEKQRKAMLIKKNHGKNRKQDKQKQTNKNHKNKRDRGKEAIKNNDKHWETNGSRKRNMEHMNNIEKQMKTI